MIIIAAKLPGIGKGYEYPQDTGRSRLHQNLCPQKLIPKSLWVLFLPMTSVTPVTSAQKRIA